jgi:hypothetical protein
MTVRYSITAAVLATLPIVALAQEATKSSVAQLVTLGSQVRIESSVVLGRPRGRVAALDDSVVSLLIDDGGMVKIPMSSITALDLHLGKRRHTLHGLGIGAAFGIGVGSQANVDPSYCGEYDFCHSRGEAIIGNVISYGALGALVGWLVRTDRWAAVTVSAITLQDRPSHRSLALAVRVRF